MTSANANKNGSTTTFKKLPEDDNDEIDLEEIDLDVESGTSSNNANIVAH